MPIYKTHAILEIDSAKTSGANDTNENFYVNFANPINFNLRKFNKKERQYVCRIENVKIPITFHNINSTNNVLDVEEIGGGTATIQPTIPVGYYTIDELVAELTTQLNTDTGEGATYTVSFDDITGKVNIAITVAGTLTSAQVLATSTLAEPIGYITGVAGAVITTNGDSPNTAFTNVLYYFKIQTDAPTSNYYDRDNLKRVALKVPIVNGRYTYQFYENDTGYYINMPRSSSFEGLHVRLLDGNNRLVDLQGVPWSFDFCIYEIRLTDDVIVNQ